MLEVGGLVALIALILAATGVAEWRNRNRRDAVLLGTLGGGSLAAASVIWWL